MNSVFEFLLDLVYDWDNVESYEWIVPDIDSAPVDVIDIIDDYIDEVDPVLVPFSWPTFGGSGTTKGQALANTLVMSGISFNDWALDPGIPQAPSPGTGDVFPIPLSRGGNLWQYLYEKSGLSDYDWSRHSAWH